MQLSLYTLLLSNMYNQYKNIIMKQLVLAVTLMLATSAMAQDTIPVKKEKGHKKELKQEKKARKQEKKELKQEKKEHKQEKREARENKK